MTETVFRVIVLEALKILIKYLILVPNTKVFGDAKKIVKEIDSEIKAVENGR